MKERTSFQRKTGYSFLKPTWLTIALTHTSYANEHKICSCEDNERLEFLGDSVLELVISEYLFKNQGKRPEGELTKIRAAIVCEDSLRRAADKIDLGSMLRLGKGEENTGGRFRSSILSDAYEALIGAIYMDGGLRPAKKFIIEQMQENIDDAIRGKVSLDYKTHLQEVLQKDGYVSIEYIVLKEEGPDHQKVFTIQLFVDGKPLSIGIGRNKKDAEQKAAKEILCQIQQKS